MAKYVGIYAALKALDPVNASAIVAASAQAMRWEASDIARFCKLIGADETEVAQTIAASRASADAGVPWFPQP